MLRLPARLVLGIALLLGLAAPVSSASAADGTLTIISPIHYKDGITVRDAVKAECGLLERVPGYVKDFAEKKGKVELSAEPAAKGRTLSIEIEEIRESGTVGPKSLTVTGELKEGGKVIGTIRVRRSSMGGPFGAFGGACGILHRCAKAIGKDIAGWLEKPAMNVEMLE